MIVARRTALPACRLLLPLVLGGCAQGVLDPAGPVARAEHQILLNATAIMLAIVVPVIVMTIAFAWWFRAGNPRAKYRPDWAYSGRLELIVWAIPALTVLFLSGIAWIGSHRLHPPRPLDGAVPPIEVQVVSLDWKWLFLYPGQGIATLNRVVVPAGRPVRFRITSASVMNSFFVPRLGSQIYAMAGMATTLHLMADRPGVYPGLSAQYSGDGFSKMRFELVALPQAGFDRFVGAVKGGDGGTLDAAAYGRLLEQTQGDRPRAWSAVRPGLFDAVSTGRAPFGEGPDAGRPHPTVSPRLEPSDVR